jgi:hypothetical protein
VRCAWLFLLALSCGARAASPAQSNNGSLASADTTATTNAIDAAAPRVCARDAKDLGACVDECDRGIGIACADAAARVERGDGVPKDLTRVVSLHERACELREIGSCVTAARMHAAGTGVPPSRAKQLELLSSACKLGDASACVVPAKAYANGSGVPKDLARATDLYERACSAGVEHACDALGDAGP